MSELVTENSLLMCSQGTLPCPLRVVTNLTVKASKQKVATVNDFTLASISTFGLCRSPVNPAVVAAFGSPQPCTPLIFMPWAFGSKKTKFMKQPGFSKKAKCFCAYAGQITVKMTPQIMTKINQ